MRNLSAHRLPTDHTGEVKWRVSEINIDSRDTCAFFNNPDTNSADMVSLSNTCANCSHAKLENGLLIGVCDNGRVAHHTSKDDLFHAMQMLEVLVANIKGGIITCIFSSKTQSSKVVYINNGWTAITGYNLEELNQELDGNPQALVFPEDKAATDREYSEQVTHSPEYELLYRVMRKDGSTIWVIDRGVITVLPDGSIQNQSVLTEITEMKRSEERLKRLAQTDQLTDLNNKVTFTLLAQKILERQREKMHAIMLIDIDNFKGINDTMGHAFGDLILKAVASQMKQRVSNRDILGRIGGDEFMVFMTDISSQEAAQELASGMCEAIAQICIDGVEHPAISGCVGVAFSEPDVDFQELYEQADAAMYRAKNSGKSRCVLYGVEV